ncbi:MULTISPECIES: Fic/DOC family protein [unclassified Clostridium]|uniref:Fic/DOC family protein n=1 Tax=unclassified Clostridium TaxID=2614128 RepID=UPI000EEEBA56|nr:MULTISPECIES: Fic family protein [unclassified Clostridium]HCQ90343.1 hypothetical protein [Clostridium sp.]
MADSYLYKGTNVLINKLNIRDLETLNQAEADFTVQRLVTVDDKVDIKEFNFEHMKKIHKHIFQDLYHWAGEIRTINMRKAEFVLDGMSVEYSDFSLIKTDIEKAINKLNRINWDEMPLDRKAKEFTEIIAEIWKVHPFREGNTRTTMKFACQYAEHHGFPMKETLFEKNSKCLRDSLVLASIGQYSENDYLEKIVKRSMEIGAKEGKKTLEYDYDR